MSALTLSQTFTAIGPGLTVSFQAYGGTPSYVYSVRPGGCGGTINASSGIYTAPASVSENPATIADTIQVRDSLGAISTASILVGTPLLLVCDIIQNQMGLAQGRVYLWDQKIMQPTDSGLYVAVSVMNPKVFGNNTSFDGSGSGLVAQQYVNMQAILDIDIISRGPAARDQKEQVVMSLQSIYSEQQQEANSFYISKLPSSGRFLNLSEIDGAAIPYRYKISFAIQYFVNKTVPISYFDTFNSPTVATNS